MGKKRIFDNDGYDKNGYRRNGFNRDGIHRNGTRYDKRGFDIEGYDKDGYNMFGFDKYGKDREGYDIDGFNKKGMHRNGTRYDDLGFDINGFNKDGIQRNGTRYDKRGFDINGYDRDGYDKEGYGRSGYNKEGINRNGLTREQQKEEIKKQQRKNFLGLINKAEKLSKGEMSLEDYIKCSKTSIEDLIVFAKKENMDASIIRGLHKYKKQYSIYKKPFSKKQYLESTILQIEGKEVRPTEEDVDKCVDYLNAMGSLVCDKTVRDTVRQYLRREIDITLKTEESQEQIEENKYAIAKNKEEIKENLIGTILDQQNRIKSQEKEIADLKSQRRSLDE